ncbi:winged helix-turn-helix domain-containing protein [Dactylosporangium sp. CA-139066]|uniref:winged helix-turn-helix domain-containing protein n=1 Tax=Dactylosporangium sp. CA-139066 TaxID=3239930 RepID=UPI003D907625
MTAVTATRRPAVPAGYELVAPATAGHLRVLSVGGVQLDLDGLRLWVDGRQVHLPLKEFELLRELMQQAGRVISRRELLDRIWGKDYADVNKTLEVHIKRLRAKVEADCHRPERIRTVRGVGYIFDLADPTAPDATAAEPSEPPGLAGAAALREGR